jgi:hypothetical protein
MPQICKETGCKKHASYGDPSTETKSKTYCAEHKKQGMVIKKVDCRVCIHDDHKSEPTKAPRASFNFPTEKKPVYCNKHKLEGMVNLNNINSEMCVICKKVAPSFGIDEKPTHCSKCKTVEMKDRVSNLCKMCNKNATYGPPGGKAEFCSPHAPEDYIDVKNKKCDKCIEIKVEFPKQPTFGINKATHCLEHKTDDMVDKRHMTEICKSCNTRATYGYDTPTYCVEHKEPKMIDLVSFKCIKCGVKQPSFANVGDKYMFCNGCKDKKMVDVRNFKCSVCKLFIVKSKTSICTMCNPDGRYRKTKEMTVVNFLQSKKFDFIHNKSTSVEHGGYKPDILFECDDGHYCIIEIDEEQHISYSRDCEVVRMFNISLALGKNCTFLRYNPDKFTNSNGDTNTNLSDLIRMEMLYQQMLYQKSYKYSSEQSIEVYHMFFNGDEFIKKIDISVDINRILDDIC